MTPQLRFPEFTDEWQVKKLGDIGKVITGNTPSTSNRSLYGHDYDFVSPGDMNTGRYVTSTKQKLSEKGFSKSRQLQPGSVLFVCIGSTIGKVAQVKSWSTTNQQINAVITDNSNENDFIYLLLTKISPKIKLLAGEQAVPIISKGSFQIIEVALPSKPEQEKIAEFLTAVDERIGAGEKKLELLQTYKRGVMQKIFSGSVRFKDANGNDYPDWEEKKLSEVFDEVTERVGSKDIETYSITAGRGFVSQTEKFGKDISGMQNERYTLLAENEFAYNKGNSKTYSYGCVYKNSEGKNIAVPNVFISFRFQDASMTAGYFEQLFINHYLDKHLRKLISSGARMDGLLNVNKKDFFEIKIPVPSQDEQQKVADFLTALDDKIKAEETKLTAARKFKKALLQRMFL